MERIVHTIDADGKIAGRLASRIAVLLMGKHRVTWVPHQDCGDRVQVSNVHTMRFSGRKLRDKVYHRSTGYPGGLKTMKLSELYEKRPEVVLRQMVYRMLPKNKLRDRMIKRLTFIKE